MTRRRVAITGLGLVTPAGNDVAATGRALLAARSGVAPIAISTPAASRCASPPKSRTCRPPLVEQAVGDRKLLKLANRSHRFALVAAAQAFADAGIRPTRSTATRWGCVVGTGMMGVTYDELAAGAAGSGRERRTGTRPAARRRSGSAADPLAFCRSQSSAGAALLTRVFGIRGYASSVHTACASGGQAVGTALKLIRRGAADCVLAGGFDSMINPVGLAGFCLLNAVSPDNDTPERASRPFDATTQRLRARRRRRVPRARGVGRRRAGAARASTPSWPATATRCPAIASPIRIRPATDRSRRCARRSPTPARRSPMSTT